MTIPNFQVIEQKIFAHDEQISYEDARKRADDKRLSAFSIFSKIFSRPDVNEIVLSYSEKRYEPFWYLVYSRWWTRIKANYKRASIHKKEKSSLNTANHKITQIVSKQLTHKCSKFENS